MSPRRWRGSGGDDGGAAWRVDVGEHVYDVAKARRMAVFVSHCADFVGGLAVKIGLLGVLLCVILAVMAPDWNGRLRWGAGALVAGGVAWSGLWQMVVVRNLKVTEEGAGESIQRTMRLAAVSGMPILLAGGALVAMVFLTWGTDDLDAWYLLGVGAVLLAAVGGPLAAVFAMSRYGEVYAALDEARAQAWPKRFGRVPVESDDDPASDAPPESQAR